MLIKGFTRLHHRKRTLRQSFDMDIMGKGEFVRRFGRDAWDRIPRDQLYCWGRRRAVGMYWVIAHG